MTMMVVNDDDDDDLYRENFFIHDGFQKRPHRLKELGHNI